MQDEKKIVIVDDHTMFRKGLCMLIDLFPQYQILFDAENGKDFIAKLTPGIVIVTFAIAFVFWVKVLVLLLVL